MDTKMHNVVWNYYTADYSLVTSQVKFIYIAHLKTTSAAAVQRLHKYSGDRQFKIIQTNNEILASVERPALVWYDPFFSFQLKDEQLNFGQRRDDCPQANTQSYSSVVSI